MRQPAKTVGPGPFGPVLLLADELLPSGLWRRTYSVAPGLTVTILAPPSAGLPDAADSVYAQIVADLVRRPGNGRAEP